MQLPFREGKMLPLNHYSSVPSGVFMVPVCLNKLDQRLKDVGRHGPHLDLVPEVVVEE
jgi:hypothetical protein